MHLLLFVLLLQNASQNGTPCVTTRELLEDLQFRRGFMLIAERHSAPKMELGVLQTTDAPPSEAPAWRLAQWATRHPLLPGRCTSLGNDTWQAETPGKRVFVERATNGTTKLLLEVRGSAEYGGHLRKWGEPWPHLLIEQRFQTPIRPKEWGALFFGLEMRIASRTAADRAQGELDPGLHTAQVSAFWTIHNLSPDHPDYEDMIWFGLPLFDARYGIPPPHYALDAGNEDASGKFICVLDGKRFWNGNTGDGTWRKLNVDLLPLIREALAITKEHGHLRQAQFEDLVITSFNLGWEVPGPYDSTLEFRELSLNALAK